MHKTILFNPVGAVHARNIDIFREYLPGWNIRCICDPKKSVFFEPKKRAGVDIRYFANGRLPKGVFKDVMALVLFSAQTRVPHAHLIEESALRSVPVVAVEEVYQMALEQGFVNEYFLPVDHLLCASDFEKRSFLSVGIPEAVAKTTGGIFRFRGLKSHNPLGADEVRAMLALQKGRPVATLCLAYLTPSGETYTVRRELLERVAEGLPGEYELVVKPHPAEERKDVERFIKRYAPRAKVADRFIPIDSILNVTDVLLNRGNSQVIVDALQRGIPIICVPAGRKILPEELRMNAVIAYSSGDIPKIIDKIRTRGSALYEPLVSHFLTFSPEEALRNTLNRVTQIATSRLLNNPEERLLDVSLFWAWMGYFSQAKRTLKNACARSGNAALTKSIENLITRRARKADRDLLRKWSGAKTVREWVIQSLWIRNIYMNGNTLDAHDERWLGEYPPRMNREIFLTYAFMLYRCRVRSGYRKEAGQLFDVLFQELRFVEDAKRLNDKRKTRNPYPPKALIWNMRFKISAKTAIKNFLWEFAYLTQNLR